MYTQIKSPNNLNRETCKTSSKKKKLTSPTGHVKLPRRAGEGWVTTMVGRVGISTLLTTEVCSVTQDPRVSGNNFWWRDQDRERWLIERPRYITHRRSYRHNPRGIDTDTVEGRDRDPDIKTQIEINTYTKRTWDTVYKTVRTVPNRRPRVLCNS